MFILLAKWGCSEISPFLDQGAFLNKLIVNGNFGSDEISLNCSINQTVELLDESQPHKKLEKSDFIESLSKIIFSHLNFKSSSKASSINIFSNLNSLYANYSSLIFERKFAQEIFFKRLLHKKNSLKKTSFW